MDLLPEIKFTEERKFVGYHMKMSLINNKTQELWQSFMQNRNQILNAVGSDLFAFRIYDASYYKNFIPANEFEKWATMEVTDFNSIPEGMEPFTLPAGLYAIFHYRGAANAGATTFQYIYGTWIHNSEYQLDDRPHFEILGEKYKNNDPTSEEEIWVPIKLKNQGV